MMSQQMQGRYQLRKPRNPPVDKATDFTNIRCDCEANGFDNVRVVKGQMTLRCRTCEYKVKVDTQLKRSWRCMDFWVRGACPSGESCKLVHLFQRKRNLRERIEAHGVTKLSTILQALPGDSLCEKVSNSKKHPMGKVAYPGTPPSPCSSSTGSDAESCSAASTLSTSQVFGMQKIPSVASIYEFRYDPYSFETACVPVGEY